MESHHAFISYAKSIDASEVPKVYRTVSADIEHLVTDRLGIDDVRKLIVRSQQKPFSFEKRVFVLITKDIALEAQNALLKLFEEPPLTALFYLVIPQNAFVLQTLLSRLCVLHTESTVEQSFETKTFEEFLHLSYGERFEMIAQKTKAKDSLWIEHILLGTELWIVTNASKSQFYKALLLVQTYIRTKGSSAKMLLEELALQIPPQ